MRDSVRRAAVLIGGGGAVLGALLYPLVIVLWAVIRVLSGLSLRPTDVDLAFVGPLAVASVCCVAAAWGAWLVFTGETHDAIQRGALLILVAALGCAAAITAQPFFVDTAGDRGLPERFRDDTEPSFTGQSVAQAAPALALLVGATLAFLASRYPSGRGGET